MGWFSMPLLQPSLILVSALCLIQGQIWALCLKLLKLLLLLPASLLCWLWPQFGVSECLNHSIHKREQFPSLIPFMSRFFLIVYLHMDCIHTCVCTCRHAFIVVVLYKAYNLSFLLNLFLGVVQLPSAAWQLFVISLPLKIRVGSCRQHSLLFIPLYQLWGWFFSSFSPFCHSSCLSKGWWFLLTLSCVGLVENRNGSGFLLVTPWFFEYYLPLVE